MADKGGFLKLHEAAGRTRPWPSPLLTVDKETAMFHFFLQDWATDLQSYFLLFSLPRGGECVCKL